MPGNYRHGYYGTPTYRSWSGMLYRCRKKGQKHWHDRGIRVCRQWLKFEVFVKDMGNRPPDTSIDRIDNNKGYFKENCRWASQRTQCRNKSNNRLFKGKTLAEWSEILGIKRSTLSQRYYVYGWSVDKTLSII